MMNLKEWMYQLSWTEESGKMEILSNVCFVFVFHLSLLQQTVSVPAYISWAISLRFAWNMYQCLQSVAYSFSSKLKAAVPSCRQTESARNNNPESSLPRPHPHMWKTSVAFIVCQSFLRRIKLQVPTVWFACTPFLAAIPFSHVSIPLQVFSSLPK